MLAVGVVLVGLLTAIGVSRSVRRPKVREWRWQRVGAAGETIWGERVL